MRSRAPKSINEPLQPLNAVPTVLYLLRNEMVDLMFIAHLFYSKFRTHVFDKLYRLSFCSARKVFHSGTYRSHR